jgi:hypothetical protein
MQTSSLTHSESEVKLEISDNDSNSNVQDNDSPLLEKKRFSILGDLE